MLHGPVSAFTYLFFFFFNDTATTEIYTLSLHDALPISLGRSYRDIEDHSGVMLPVRSARCRYLRGAHYDDAVAIETGVVTRTRAGVTFAYRIVPESGGTPHAVGLTEHFFMNGGGQPVRAPAEVEALLERAPVAPAEILALLEG